MHTFTDSKQRNFTLSLTFGTLKRVKADTGHNLGRPFTGTPPLLMVIGDDPLAIVEICGSLVAGQHSLDAAKFVETFAPEDYPALRDAFAGELGDFFLRMGEPDAKPLFEATTKTRPLALAKGLASIRSSIAGLSDTSLPGSSA